MVMTPTQEREPPVDDELVAALVSSHRRFLSFVEQRVESRDAAEEILQAAFAKAVEKRGDVRDAEASVAWFFRLLRNALVDHYRRRAARDRALEALAAEAARDFVLDDELHREVCGCFEDLMPTLKPEYAHIIRAVDLEGRPVVEVAEALGITSNHAGVRLHRARKALRSRLERACATCAEHGCLDCTCDAGGRGADRAT